MTLSSGPHVSVLMTIFNAAPYLRESIDSLFAQTFSDWELIAIENGSTDQSLSILRKYSDPRVRTFLFQKNIGRTPALRYAFSQARGEYVAVLDADDISHPPRLERQSSFLDKHPEVALVGSWVKYIDEKSSVIAKWKPPVDPVALRDSLGWTNPMVHSSVMYRRLRALEAGGYPEHVIYSQDFGLIIELARRSSLAIIDDFLCDMRVVSTSMTRDKKYSSVFGGEALAHFEHAAQTLPLSSKARRLNRRVRSISRIEHGIGTMRTGSIPEGVKSVLRGVFSDPTVLWANGTVYRFAQRHFPRLACILRGKVIQGFVEYV